MKKAQLLKLPILKATAHMMKLAADDELQYSRVKVGSYGNNEKGYKYGLYLRCKVFDNILKVAVTAGQAVNEGDLLVVLEAMKMENEIFAPKAGTVAQVLVSKGSTVDTGATMVVLN